MVLTQVAVPKYTRLIRFGGDQICERREVSDVVPTL